MKVSIIIVNYNTCALTRQALSSIYDKVHNVSFEIIVVDNASLDNSIDEIKMLFPDVILIESDVNLGFGRANNLGFSKSKGEYIFLLNSDTILMNDAVSILSKALDHNKNFGMCGGNLYTVQGKPTVSYCNIFPGIFFEFNSLLKGIPYLLMYRVGQFYNKSGKIKLLNGYLCGADIMIRRDVIEEVGFFDPDFFMYYEETELCYRVKKRGFKIASVPNAKIIHLEGGSEEVKVKTIERLAKGKYCYYAKVFPRSYIKLLHFITVLFQMCKFHIYKMLKKQNKYERCSIEIFHEKKQYLSYKV